MGSNLGNRGKTGFKHETAVSLENYIIGLKEQTTARGGLFFRVNKFAMNT